MTKDTGGPAFANNHQDGATLRDYFAGQVMQAWIVDVEEVRRLQKGDQPDWGLMARTCYSFADAMITERSKP